MAEKFLESYKGLAVVISHDHRFLDSVCTHIADVDYETVILYRGGYTAFEAAKEAERERKEAEIQKREKQIAGHMAFVDCHDASAADPVDRESVAAGSAAFRRANEATLRSDAHSRRQWVRWSRQNEGGPENPSAPYDG